MPEIQDAFLFGLFAMVGFGVMNALSRRQAKELDYDRALFWRGVFVVGMHIPLLLLFFPEDASWAGVLLALAVGLFGYLPIFFFYRALAREPVGVISPIANSASVITILLGVFLLGESFDISRWIGVFVVLLGVVFLSGDAKLFAEVTRNHKTSGIPFALLACLLWGVVFFLFRYPVLLIGPVLTSFVVESSVLALSAGRMYVRNTAFRFPGDFFRNLFALSLFGVVGMVAYNRGLETATVSTVAAFYMANPLVATATAAIIYRERLSAVRYAGLALAIIGVILVAVG